MARALDDVELESYTVLPREVAERVRIVRFPLLPPGADGMTLGRYVLLRSDKDRSGHRALIAHELVHVRQYADEGFVRFLAKYVSSYVRNLVRLRRHRLAYEAIPAEQEARQVTRDWLYRKTP